MSDPFLIARYLHFVGIFLVVSTLFCEIILLKPNMTSAEVKRLAKVDGIYGLGAILTVVMGLWMWLGDIGKPSAFYAENPLFLLKFSIFILVGLLSIWPTIFFIRKGRQQDSVAIPKAIKMLVHIELTLVFLIPILAVLMARGEQSIF